MGPETFHRADHQALESRTLFCCPAANLPLADHMADYARFYRPNHACAVASMVDCLTHAVADKMATESGAHSNSGKDREARLRGHAEYFSTMLNLIPAKYYFVEDDQSTKQGGKYIKHKKKSTVQRGGDKKASKKAKTQAVDPFSRRTIEDIQKEKEEAEQLEQEKFIIAARESGASVQPLRLSSEVGGGATRDELQARLQEKIAKLRSQRKIGKRPAVNSKEKAAKRMRRNKNPKEHKDRRVKGSRVSRAGGSASTNTATESNLASPAKPSVVDKNGRVVFSKFDFVSPSEPPKDRRAKKDFQKLLAKAEREQKKLKQLKETDEKKGEEIEAKLLWKKALSHAKGEKMRDDPSLLKKTIKRQDAKKRKSQKEWKARAAQVELLKKRKQELRQTHIQERIERKKARKMKKRKPGF